MTDKLLYKLKAAEELAEKGLIQGTAEAKREIYLYTFSDTYTSSERVAENLRIPTVTAKKVWSHYLNGSFCKRIKLKLRAESTETMI